MDLTPPFALLRRDGHERIELLRGETVTAARLADLPRAEPGVEQLALVPYRQLRERGDACHDDGTPLTTLLVREHREVTAAELPRPDAPRIHDGSFDVCDDDYARQVKAVLDEEIGRGEGANFVLRRSYVGHCDDPLKTAFGAFRNLLTQESGAYWTFLVHTGTRIMVGATPERHVSLHAGVARMNPISGTLHKPPADTSADELLAFLRDPKERDELAMVVDEELKMLADVGGHGRVTGPFLKEMSRLTHTEYHIEARTSLDPREILRRTMFAPTATGSPIRNALRVIKRHETGGRGYYGGVAALIGADPAGRPQMDASLLLRVAYLDPADGSVRVPVGATLVRGSDPDTEVRETHAKASGVLRAFGVASPPAEPVPHGRTAPRASAGGDPRVSATLAARNENLARFWLAEHAEGTFAVAGLAGRSVLIVDNEDAFTSMLAVQLAALGLDVTRTPYSAVDGTPGYDRADGTEGFDLVVLGPGPGDPADRTLPKTRVGHALLDRLLAADRPLLAVCLGHQLLCAALGFELVRRPEPNQGTQISVDLFGRRELVGFYNSFTALAPDEAVPGLDVCTRPDTREVVAVRGGAFTGLQFHAESILSRDGIGILRREVCRLLGAR